MKKFKVDKQSPLKASAIPFLLVFAMVGTLIVTVSRAETVVDCQNSTSYKFVAPGTRDDNVLGPQGTGLPSQRTYSLGATIKAGTYKIYATGADDHFNHRSASPTEDIQIQPDERLYVQLDNVITPNATSDFTDYYDWTTASGKYQDDDNNIMTVPANVYADGGEYLGTITITHDTSSVTFLHYSMVSATDTAHPSSVVPGLLTIQCAQTNAPLLKVNKTVDGNNDSVYGKSETVSKGVPTTWKVRGSNEGSADEGNAQIRDCLPNGVNFVESSAQHVSGINGQLNYDNGSRCVIWTGQLKQGEDTTFIYQTMVAEAN